MEQAWSLILYFVIAAVVVFVSIKLSDYVDLLDKKTKISGAFLGGILLAATTSLPELFTSLTATLFVKNNSLVVGDIIGSNLFNFALFFIIYTIFFKKVIDAKVNKFHIFSLLLMALMYITVAVAGYVFDFYHILWGWFNPLSILVVAIYSLNLLKTPKEDISECSDEVETKLTVKQIIILFIIFSLVLIGSSIGLTYVTDWVVRSWGFGSTFGGALFLAVATSLPELTSTINLCKRNNLNAAYGNIIGSNIFNFTILAFADLFSFNCPNGVYHFYFGSGSEAKPSFFLLVLGGFSLIVVLLTLLVKFKGNKLSNKVQNIIYISSGILVFASYLAFLILSNVNIPALQ